MIKKIVLPQRVRLFSIEGILLAKTGLYAEAGTEGFIGPVVGVAYDHQSQTAMSFQCDAFPETYYILVSESGISPAIH